MTDLVIIIISILAIACCALLAWAMEERRKRSLAEDRYEMTKTQRDQAVERFDSYLNKKVARDEAFENHNLQRQGIPIPNQPPEEKKPRQHAPIGGAARLEKYFADRPAPAPEPPRTVRPTDKVN